MENNNFANVRSNVTNKSNTRFNIPKPLKFGLIGLFFFLGVYFLVLPFLPGIAFLLTGSTPSIPYSSKIEDDIWKKANISNDSRKTENKKIPDGRRLVIPTLNVDMPIVEAADESGLAYGVWRRPNGGTINSGNMILTGHRLGYGFLPSEIMKSSSFYNLDKLKDGDYIIIYWDGEEYDYVVKGGETVLPTEVRIENPTTNHQLTLYTCTPIGINTHRLVKYAYPVEEKTAVTSSESTSSVSTISIESDSSQGVSSDMSSPEEGQ